MYDSPNSLNQTTKTRDPTWCNKQGRKSLGFIIVLWLENFGNRWGFCEKKWEREVTPEFGERKEEKILPQIQGVTEL
jgi:hypothetical protein